MKFTPTVVKPRRFPRVVLLSVATFLLFLAAFIPVTGGAAQAGAFNPPVGADQALKTAAKGIPVPDDFTLAETQYLEGRYVQGGKVWAFAWTKQGDGTPETINVQVDAVTGQIRAFNRARLVSGGEVQNREKARSIAGRFVNRLQPGKLTQTRPAENAGREAPQAATFRYIRLVNGIPYDDNGFSVTVADAEVVAYRYAWDDVQFPDSSRVISSERAYEILRERFGLELAYFRPFAPDGGRGRPKLVYRLRQTRPVVIDALTGDLVSYADSREQPQAEDDRPLTALGSAEASKSPGTVWWVLLGLSAFMIGAGAGFRLARWRGAGR